MKGKYIIKEFKVEGGWVFEIILSLVKRYRDKEVAFISVSFDKT